MLCSTRILHPHLSLLLPLMLAAVLTATSAQAQTNFGPQQVITNQADGTQSVYAADLDGDGDTDVLSASEIDNEIAWYENLGPNQAPTADAGTDQTVLAGQIVTLDGSNSADPDGDALTFAWTLTGPGAPPLSDPAATRPTFCAAAPGAYTATLVVNDGTEDAEPATARVTALSATAALDALIADVEALRGQGVLNKGQANGLTRNLVQAQRLLARGMTAEALAVLADMRQQALGLWQRDGVLTEAQAQALVASAGAPQGYAAEAFEEGLAPEGSSPAGFALAANYPNPFNPSTEIAFVLPEAAAVRLVVYDMLGREVALLAEGPLSAGRHTVRFEASNLPSGTYLYRIEAGAFAQTRRMVLLK
jgi:hypothetical protein